ncbi:YifB family Mg chelatase-like AAA ATPase [Anoxynatronum buryatiense]|uniref:Magnesium chelatase family protein n=1 Tax=Anoxynatronum buryatiense TaxID=489973 RepID=A0AA45WUB4_9CLOT|nr:YifB family Mg chelatase-like AAA ATPase [Anoxynatronum buryatiense]SMP47137.1 magnesium chelatase family protein [Anoxynatronum buryatiense]
MLSKTTTASLTGLHVLKIDVEVDTANGLPTVNIVGLPDAAVKESRDRVRAAIDNSGFQFPMQRVTVNLAPADSRKEGSHFDLPIALAILLSTGQLPAEPLKEAIMLGELSLDGSILRINGALPMMMELQRQGYNRVILPWENRYEAGLLKGLQCCFPKDLRELNSMIQKGLTFADSETFSQTNPDHKQEWPVLADLRGQENVKRALEIAAAGAHNLLLIGPPGSGKTMAARRLPAILPEMSFSESMEVAVIQSAAGLLTPENASFRQRPFRAPHHTTSAVALAGGGRIPRPGEISLSHRGVLFLDELPEFDKRSMEILRQPLEDGCVVVSRSAGSFSFPSEFMLVAAMNPCPCGYAGFEEKGQICQCAPHQVQRYTNKISGPMLDRIDLFVESRRIEYEDLTKETSSENTATVREKVRKAREIQRQRYRKASCYTNSGLKPAQINQYCPLEPDAEKMMKQAFDRMKLSARGYHRILKVARSIADLDASEIILQQHLAEALQFRNMHHFKRS